VSKQEGEEDGRNDEEEETNKQWRTKGRMWRGEREWKAAWECTSR